MDVEFIKRWVVALRSGQYKQQVGALKFGLSVPTHCCLGVACDVDSKDTGVPWEGSGSYCMYRGESTMLPNEVAARMGLPVRSVLNLGNPDWAFISVLMEMNDTHLDSFDTIADKIETYFKLNENTEQTGQEVLASS